MEGIFIQFTLDFLGISSGSFLFGILSAILPLVVPGFPLRISPTVPSGITSGFFLEFEDSSIDSPRRSFKNVFSIPS